MVTTLSIALIGPGLVGSAFLSQIQQHIQSPRIKTIAVSLAAILNSRKLLVAPKGQSLNITTCNQDLDSSPVESSIEKLIAHLTTLPNPIVVDCTSSAHIASSYPLFLQNNIHIVTPNKKAFSSEPELFSQIKKLSYPENPTGPFVYHESTVGAGLPVLSTLNDLIQTGDEVVKVEGVVSGTLAYIFGKFSPVAGEAQKFSECVKVAKDLGYTEPDPRDDLNGLDVARKCLILSRLSGLNLSLSDLNIKNLIPSQLRDVPLDQFMSRLNELDSEMESVQADAKKAGSVVRYVGVVDVKAGKVKVELGRYPHNHPFANLQGSDNMIAFTTKRFPNPLIIQGAGAGADVTAFGIFSDLLKIGKSLRK
ncbi:homoserine dehydrogenase-domain-containing protein [Paraphysoderma sedebokerense]|nr:homoserine dehydrogenase-domain-containing protein [Paraphysoderma sedebokerense]